MLILIFLINFYIIDFDYSLKIAKEVEPIWVNRQEMQCSGDVEKNIKTLKKKEITSQCQSVNPGNIHISNM